MSRIGKNPITLPEGAKVKAEGQTLQITGKKGSMSIPWFGHRLRLRQEENQIWIEPQVALNKKTKQMWGTQWRLLFSALEGTERGFEKCLELHGVGMRVQQMGKDIKLQLGFSHDIIYTAPDDVELSLSGDRNNVIHVRGIDKQRVGQVASDIRIMNPAEVYKGKGIRYQGEQIILKEGKKK